MIKIKHPIACLVMVCALMGTAAGAVVERVSRNIQNGSEICVVVDAGHQALGECFK